MLSWMYWTMPVAIIFAGVFAMIAGMTIWGHYAPPHRRKGFLQIVTDRTERLYISIITFAFLMVIVFFLEIETIGLAAIAAASVSVVILKWG
jgi:predicted small integral membrane protein